MIGVDEARGIASAKLASKLAQWATQPTNTPVLSVSLKPPLEREVRSDELAAETWVRKWSETSLPDGADLDWEPRTWRSIGQQQVPVRLRFRDVNSVASFAGGTAARDWKVLRSRVARLRETLGFSEALDAAIRRHAVEILRWAPPRFEQVVQAVDWLAANSVRGLRPRQIPIRGVDTKWFNSHRSVMTDLHRAATGSAGLGIVDADRMVRVRILDPTLAPSGISDFSAPPAQLASLDLRPDVVFIFENLESVLAMPEWPGAIVLHGDGYAVDVVGNLPWVQGGCVIYWGDLDSHGFAILHRLRTHLPTVISALMDEQTLLSHRDLWVSDPKPTRAKLELQPTELNALDRLREEGDAKLEQERIPWEQALRELHSAARAAESPSE
ncbi:Wadjet anti-phage system protein JetD domain-containing protein [Ruania alkalisoli]|uniref:Wadjet anti-phage system protein JetD domain-containing protein n=1 Tax=Ruania alkalisoli TaxID=2779775 RepID=UPI001FECF923|nr:Wadjet anti-phage system protein JetD domain-containing protein [Ruania alkalisoli]